MIYPDTFEEKTGFSQVRSQLAGYCISEGGLRHVEEVRFSADPELIRLQLKQTREFLTILEKGLSFPSSDYHDLTPVLGRIRTPGTWMLPEELHDLKLSLMTISACLAFFRSPAARPFEHLKALAGDLEVPAFLLREAERILDDKGNVRDQASPELASIRKEIHAKTGLSQKIILQALNQAKSAGWAPAESSATLSEGRMVIPLLAAHKRKLRGIIHDESASGQTVYLEPEICIDINNEIRELESAEKREIIRILIRFTDMVRPETDLLQSAYEFLGLMDFIRAKAKFALDIQANEPLLSGGPAIGWVNTRHPLLERSLRLKQKTIVPLNLKLDDAGRILVITGPNAGGKSVCLKTTGLIQYMIQCGMLVPMQPDSQAGVFQQMFIDIGDEQSLENDLSTYSSHLLNLKLFIEKSDAATLFLVDELGTGTDPALGGAIAEAAIEKLAQTGAYGVVTTHYSNLKLLEGRVAGVINGAMLFDTERLQPLYQLSIGKPGSSFTFEIARRIGFTEEIIRKAIEKAGTTHLDFEQQLRRLESEKILLEKKLKEFEVADGFLGELIEKYEKLNRELENARLATIEQARQEARQLVEQSNRVIEKTIREIKESQADREKTKSARQQMDEFRKSILQPAEPAPASPVKKDTQAALKPGDWVSVEGQKVPGKIFRIKGGKAMVDFEGVRLSLSVDKLLKTKAPEASPSRQHTSIYGNLNEKAVNFKLTLDLRGKTAEEALQMVQRYIDDAYLLRIREVSILHGKGEGVLRKVIRDYLSGQEFVVSFADEHVERGGSGITRVTLG